MGLLVMVAMFGLIWVVFMLPQQKKMKAHRAMMAQLEVGDDVLTSAGIYGQITEFDGNAIFLAVSDNLEIKVTLESVSERVTYSDEVADDVDEPQDSKKK